VPYYWYFATREFDMRVEAAVLINADADTVFRFITAPENEPAGRKAPW